MSSVRIHFSRAVLNFVFYIHAVPKASSPMLDPVQFGTLI